MTPQITRNVAKLTLQTLSVTGWRAHTEQLHFIRHGKYMAVDRWARATQRTMSADTVPTNET